MRMVRDLVVRVWLLLGPLGVFGLALVVGAWVADVYLAREASAAEQVLQEQRGALRMRLQALSSAPPLESPAQGLRRWQESLPDRSELSILLGQLNDKAIAHQLAVGQVQQSDLPDSGMAVERVQILYPVRGSYAAVRGWLDEVLTAQSALAIENAGFRRTDSRSAEVTSTLRIVVYLRRQA